MVHRPLAANSLLYRDFRPTWPLKPQHNNDTSAALTASPVMSATPDTQADNRTAELRRPTTENQADFWYCSVAKWNELVADTGNKSKTKVALNALRKFDAAGRIMETDEGVIAAVACSWCTRDTSTPPCCVFKDANKGLGCAFCRRNAKAGCGASLEHPPMSLEDRLGLLESRLEGMDALEAEVKQLRRELEGKEALENEVKTLREDLNQHNTWRRQLCGEPRRYIHHVDRIWEWINANSIPLPDP